MDSLSSVNTTELSEAAAEKLPHSEENKPAGRGGDTAEAAPAEAAADAAAQRDSPNPPTLPPTVQEELPLVDLPPEHSEGAL